MSNPFDLLRSAREYVAAAVDAHRHDDGVDLLAKIAAALTPNLWRPINSAPRDGTAILLCVAGWQPALGMWFEDPSIKVEGRWISFDPQGVFTSDEALERYLGDTTYEPTHWQPAPATARWPDEDAS